MVHTVGFYSLKIWLFDCRGHCLHRYCPAFPKTAFCPNHQHVLLLFCVPLVLLSFFLFCFCFFLEQGLCYVYVSEAHFLAESKD